MDRDKNCLNDKSSCFKADTTAPSFVSTSPSNAPTDRYTVLPYIDLTFSEEVKNGESIDAYTIDKSPNIGSSVNGGVNLEISSGQKIGPYTYRINLRGSVTTGTIRVHFGNITDYNGNTIAGTKYVDYEGSASVGISLKVFRNATSLEVAGVSNNGNGAHGSVDIRFSHQFTIDNANSYTVYRTDGGVSCPPTGVFSSLGSGANLAANQDVLISNVPATTFQTANDQVIVCISNTNNPAATGVAFWPLIRDDVPPTVSIASAVTDTYRDPFSVTLSCANNKDQIAYSTAVNPGSSTPPTDPVDPDFTSGVRSAGALYASPIPVINDTNPTVTKIRWRCMDKSGNKEISSQMVVLTVDNTIPAVNVNLDANYHAYVSTAGGAYNTTTLNFTSDQANKTFRIVKGDALCSPNGAPDSAVPPLSASLIGVGPFTTNSVANGANSPQVINASLFNNGLNNVRICVQGPVATTWGTAYLQITRDNGPLTATPSVLGGDYGATQAFSVTCQGTIPGLIDKVAYTVATQLGSTAPTAPADPTFTSGAITVGQEMTGPYITPDASTTIIKYRCLDKAGNQSSVGQQQFRIDASLPSVQFVSANRTATSSAVGAYNDVDLTWTASRAGLTYRIRRVLDCNHAGDPGNTILTGTTATVGTNNVSNLGNALFPLNHTQYPVRICVYNLIGQPGYQTASVNITRDNIVPTFGGLTAISTPATGSSKVDWPAATDGAGTGVAFYRVYQTQTAGDYSSAQVYIIPAPATSLTATGLNPLNTYYFIAGAVDSAGNETKVTTAELASKPTIRIIISGLSGSMRLSDGITTSPLYLANVPAPGTIWSGTLGVGDTYNFSVTQQPTGQICAIQEKQFGTLTADVTLNVLCTTGQMVAGRFQQTKASNVSYMLYRGVSTALASSQTNPTSLIYAGGYIFYGNYADCDGGTPGNQYCLFKVPASSGSVATHVTGLTAPVRGVTTDGTNIYFSVTTPDNGVYKVPVAGGTPTLVTNTITTPYGLAIEGNYLYVCSGGAMTIRRIDLSSGTISDIVGPLANYPLGIEIVGTELYFTTWGTHAIYRAPKSGGSATVAFGSSGTSGMQDGNGTGALLNQPHDLVYDGVDNLYFAEYGGNRMKKAKLSTGRVITLLGDGSAAFSLGSGPSAKIQNPVGITTDGKRIFLSNHNAGSSVMRIGDQNNVGYWPLNGQVSDYSSDGFNGSFDMTQTGSHTLVLGRYGEANGAYRFDGGSTWFSTPHQNQFNLTSSYTISAWINTNSTANQRIVDKATAGSANGYVLDIVSNRYRLIHGVSASTEIMSNAVTTTGSWVHLLATYSQLEKRARLYINGHLDAEQVFGTSASTPTNTLPLRLGSDSNNANVFSGAMAAVRLYGRVLSDAEINELAQDASPTQVGNSFNTGPTEAMVIYQFTGGTAGGANMTGSSPVSSSLIPSCSSPAGKDGDAAGSCYLDGNNNLTASSGGSAGTPWGSAPRTLCIWYNPPVFPNNDVLIAHGRGAAPNLQGFGISVLNANQIQFFNWGGPNVVFNYQTQLNTWQHVCGTLSGSTVEMFINGKSIGSDTGTIGTVNTVNDATSTLTFGSSPDGNPALRLNGNIDDARIYNKVLTPAEIRQLATQIPSGLVARYDFDGDTNDVSGYGNNLTNSGATPSADRFGAAAKAYHFNGVSNSMFNSSVTLPLSTGNANRTMCFWGRADQAIAGVRIGVAYGNSSINQASQIGFNSMDTNAPSTLGCAYGAPCSPAGYIHQNTWHHVCMVVNALNAQLYLNGGLLDTNGPSAGTTVSAATWNTQAGPIEVGSFSGNYRFPGDLDDIRIYNRALSTAEIQALVQQPNKKIYVTNSAYNGNLAGISGADAKCNSGDANKPGGAGNFKAMLTDSGSNTLRRACTTSYCSGTTTGISEGIDWVLRPNTTYLRALDGLPVFTANYNGIFDFSTNNFTNAIHTTSFQVWTGINFGVGGEWTIDGGPGQCGSSGTNIGWMSSAGPYNGVYGNSSAAAQTTTPAGVLYNGFETAACTVARRLYCVEQ
ncbi:MAG: DUF1554 domain-containing protein [Turneriella sp.]|nr:DUF1554 domain-containing protein [Turneriella sp.]